MLSIIFVLEIYKNGVPLGNDLIDASTSVRSLVKTLVRPVYVGGAGCEANAMLIASRFQVPNWDGWSVITASIVVTVSCYDLICVIYDSSILLYSLGKPFGGK